MFFFLTSFKQIDSLLSNVVALIIAKYLPALLLASKYLNSFNPLHLIELFQE